jgi:hypothetical protein
MENRQFGVCLPTLVKPAISFSNYCTFFVLMEAWNSGRVLTAGREDVTPFPVAAHRQGLQSDGHHQGGGDTVLLIAGYQRFCPSVTNRTAQPLSFKLEGCVDCRWLYMKVYWWLLTVGGSGTTGKSESDANTRPKRLSPSIAHSICTGPIIALGIC